MSNEKLNEKQQKAIIMRYKGVSSVDISKEIDINEHNIRGWFMKGGKLEKRYKEYEKERNEELMEKAKLSDEQMMNICKAGISKYALGLKNRPVDKVGIKDLKELWKIYRVLQGKPTDFIKEEVEGELNIKLVNYGHLDTTPVQAETVPAGDTEQPSKE